MNKKIIVLLMVFVLIFSVSGCKKAFEYEEAMDQGMETIQNATKYHTLTTLVFDDDFGTKIVGLTELADDTENTESDIEEMKKAGDTLSNLNLVVEQKVDLDEFIVDMTMKIDYASEKFLNINMLMNDSFMFFNEPDLLKQGAMVKFSFINDMMSEMTGGDNTDLIDTIKTQVVEQQQMTQKFLPIIDKIIEENVDDPEVLETTIDFKGEALETNEVKYSMTYAKALELVKIFLEDEEFMSLYEETVKLQIDSMNAMSGGMQTQSEEEVMIQLNDSIDEIEKSIDETLADPEIVKVLENYNLDVSYYFDDGIKAVAYDFDFFSVKSDYYSINEAIEFDIPTEESSYVIEDQMGMFGAMGIVNQEAVENLQNHKLVTDFNALQTSTPEY